MTKMFDAIWYHQVKMDESNTKDVCMQSGILLGDKDCDTQHTDHFFFLKHYWWCDDIIKVVFRND